MPVFETGDRVKPVNPAVSWSGGTIIVKPQSDPWQVSSAMVRVQRDGKDGEAIGVLISIPIWAVAATFQAAVVKAASLTRQ